MMNPRAPHVERFDTVDPSSIRWTNRGGRIFADVGSRGRLATQTPKCGCRITLHKPGMYRVDMRLNSGVDTHAAFADWVGRLEQSVIDLEPELSSTKSLSRCVYNGNLRLMAFSDTLAFDADGKLSVDFLSAAACACVLELQGAWTTDARWGLRWKIVHLKFWPEWAEPEVELPSTTMSTTMSVVPHRSDPFLNDDD